MNKPRSIGGQAVLEGVMMRDGATGTTAVAVRKASGEIQIVESSFTPLSKRYKFFGIPFIRGMFALVESLITGMKTLTDSAKIIGEEFEEEYSPSKFERFIAEKLHLKPEDVMIGFALILGVALAFFLFSALPTLITKLFGGIIESAFIKSAIEGAVKITVFILYLFIVSRLKDIKRVFQYHGAEHKTIDCYEKGIELTPENVAKCSRLHPRCGTSFLFFVIIISIFVSTLLPWGNTWLRIALKLLLLPVVSGISYEFIRLSGRVKSKALKILVFPGLLMQRITTAEPDISQIEVAVASFNNVLTRVEGDNSECSTACSASCVGDNTDEGI